MRRNLDAPYFSQGCDLGRFRQSADVGRRQIENRRCTLSIVRKISVGSLRRFG